MRLCRIVCTHHLRLFTFYLILSHGSTIVFFRKLGLSIWLTNLGMLTPLRSSDPSMISRALLKKLNQINGVNLSEIWPLRTVDNCGLARTPLLTIRAVYKESHDIFCSRLRATSLADSSHVVSWCHVVSFETSTRLVFFVTLDK